MQILKVVALSSGRQVQRIDTRVTNFSLQLDRKYLAAYRVILGTLTLQRNWSYQGAKGADARQEKPCLDVIGSSSAFRCQQSCLIDKKMTSRQVACCIDRSSGPRRYVLPREVVSGINTQQNNEWLRGFLGSVIV